MAEPIRVDASRSDALAVLSGATFVDQTEPDYEAMAALVDVIHVRELRRACGCPNCRAYLKGSP